MINLNTLLVSLFSPAQIVAMVLVAVLLALLIGLNLYMMYLNHKRGEHKMHTKQLQQQRDALMDKLAALRSGTYVNDQSIVEGEDEEEEEDDDLALTEEDDENAEEVSFVGDSEEVEEQEAEIEVDETGKVIRYNRSFTARIIQSSDEVKTRYSELKNYLLSFENVHSRISWRHEIFTIGKKTVAKINMRGKTLCLCLATDPKLFDGTKYLVDNLSVRNEKNPMSCMYRIKSERRVRYAKELIDIVMAGFNTVQKDTYMTSDFVMPYEATHQLINRKLVKLIESELSEIEREEAIAAAKGIRYNRSFEARLLQADDALKGNYVKVKNYLLAHGGVSAQVSWKHEVFRRGKSGVAALTVRGKTLCLRLAGDPKKLEGSKFKIEDISLKDPATDLPILYRINNSRRLTGALQLIDRIFGEAGIGKIERIEETYELPFTPTNVLIEKGLIKVTETKAGSPFSRRAEPFVSADEEIASAVETAEDTPEDTPEAKSQSLYVAKDKSVVVVEDAAADESEKKE